MPTFDIKSPVTLFTFPEYGTRLLFKNAISNPRDTLGKNGVTFHSWFTSFFYKTVAIQATIDGQESPQTFYVNRNSLIKYLGNGSCPQNTDKELLEHLEAKFWNDDDAIKKQAHAGQVGLRHAGQHHHLPLVTSFIDTIKASFLGWLFQKAIVGINSIKALFLFVRTESDLFNAGEQLAIQRVHEAYAEVPAYKKHISNSFTTLVEASNLSEIPTTSKDNYIKVQEHDADTHRHGKYPKLSKTDTSTGTTGKPSEWVRGEPELQAVKDTMKLAVSLKFGSRRLAYINAFALGPWATGLTTYEFMRETGSVFATGADKEKIIDKVLSIAKDEAHQLAIAIEAFGSTHQELSADDKTQLSTLVDDALTLLLRDREATVINSLTDIAQKSSKRVQPILIQYQSELIALTDCLNADKQQIILTGYPPFLKDVASEAKTRGYDLKSYSVAAIVGGQGISEAMRDQLLEVYQQVHSSYGASDLDINLGVEMEFAMNLRKVIAKNPGLGRELYGSNKGLPMIFHYHPMNYHVECDENDELIFTCTRSDRSSPRIRYDLGDKGRVYASSDVQALLCKYGIFNFNKPKTNFPLMFIWGRDATVIFNGANLTFDELENAMTTNEALKNCVLKKAFYKVDDEHFEIWLELNDQQELPQQDEMEAQANHIYRTLAQSNQDFKYQLDKLLEGVELPTIRYFKRGQSPISEAGGHRKQVLIFEKGVNLHKEYLFPDEENCTSFTLRKSALLLEAQEAKPNA